MESCCKNRSSNKVNNSEPKSQDFYSKRRGEIPTGRRSPVVFWAIKLKQKD